MLLVAPLLLLPVALAGQRRTCGSPRQPDPLPMAMELVDSMALATSVADVPLPFLPDGPTTFSLWYDAIGRVTHVLALADSLVARGTVRPDSAVLARARLGTLIAGAAFPQDSVREMAVRLTVARDRSGAIALSVGRSVFCGPQRHPSFHPPNERIRGTIDDVDEYVHANPAEITFVVDTTGHALMVLVTRSSGSSLIDSRAVESIMSARYDPGTVDGYAKKVSIRLNVLAPIPAPRQGPP